MPAASKLRGICGASLKETHVMLRPRLVWLPAVILALAAGRAPAQEGPLDLIPNDASFGLVIKNLAGLREKGEKFLDTHKIDLPQENRPSALFEKLLNHLKIEKGLDEKGSMAVVLPNLKKVGVKRGELFGVLMNLHVVVPFTDLDKIAGNFKKKAADLKPGEVIEIDNPDGFAKYLLVKGKHLIVGARQEALEWYDAGKPVTGDLSPAQRAALAKSDIALHLGIEPLSDLGKSTIDNLEEAMIRQGDTEGNAVSRQFIAALRQVRFVAGGLHLGDDSSIDLVASFPKGDAGKAAKTFLEALRAGPGYSDLVALPDHDPLFAYAAKGDGVYNVAMVRALLNIIIDKGGLSDLLPDADRKKFHLALEPAYKHLKGSRAALYRTTDESKGLLAGVGILDLDDPEAHLAEYPKMLDVFNTVSDRLYKDSPDTAPHFRYTPKAETVNGLRVDHLQIRFRDLPKETRHQMKQLYGPDWDTLRLAVRDKNVVVLFGSDQDLWKETLRNQDKGLRGLADNKVMKEALAKLAPERKIELHYCLKNLVPFLDGPDAGKAVKTPVGGFSSIAMIAEPDRFQIQITAAKSEVQSFAKLLGFPIK
jgi:hypothetical protein